MHHNSTVPAAGISHQSHRSELKLAEWARFRHHRRNQKWPLFGAARWCTEYITEAEADLLLSERGGLGSRVPRHQRNSILQTLASAPVLYGTYLWQRKLCGFRRTNLRSAAGSIPPPHPPTD